MSKLIKILLVGALALSGLSMGAAAQAQNDAEDDISSETAQTGASSSGDAVGGQITGVVSSGDASVDATNRSEDVDVETGDATATNLVTRDTGQLVLDTAVVIESSITGIALNTQEGEISSDISQAADATSGDGVGGQIIGVVTSAGGSADVVAANTSEDVDVETGNALALNEAVGFVGQQSVLTIGIENAIAGVTANTQDGDSSSDISQAANAATGDGVGGQVLGIVSAGDASVDATNRSEDVDIESGDATADNFNNQLTGQLSVAGIGIADAIAGVDLNTQEGDNSSDISQAADAASGDGVGGQVIGVVTSAGGSADVVAANTSEDVDAETGDALADNENVALVGQETVTSTSIDEAIAGVSFNNQDGDNSADISQAANAATGDGVGGQVLGIVSAGDTSVDATNRSEDVDIESGDATADNLVGEHLTGQLAVASVFIDTALAGVDLNTQEGDNSSDLSQVADSASGDGVGGQVIGVVTSAGGSADVVAANTSEDVDVETGDALADNENVAIVGQEAVAGITIDTALVGLSLNEQVGDNSADHSQAADATTGDGVGGQVLGVVSSGDASVDATNESSDVDIATGDAVADNFVANTTGQVAIIGTTFDTTVAEIEFNTLDGDVSSHEVQEANAASGDAVGGLVAGVVTSAGGSADLVLANASDGVDGESGESFFFNTSEEFVGQQATLVETDD